MDMGGGGRAAAMAATMACALAGFATALPATASADFGVSSFDAGVCNHDVEPSDQCTRDTPAYFFRTAGGHPDFGITDFKFNTTGAFQTPDGNVRDVHVDLPVGLSVNPEATPKCEQAQLEAGACPADAAVGTNYITAISGGAQVPISTTVYNMVQPAGMPARFGMTVPLVGGQIYLDGGVAWDGDYHESFDIKAITNAIPLVETRLVFDGKAGDGTFITMPSQCSGPQTTGLDVDSYQDPGVYRHYSTTTPVGAIGCDRLPFSPGVSVTSDTRRAGAPAGVTIDVTVPQNPNGKAQPNTATLKDAHVALPAGMALNPSAATGLEACTDAQLGKGTKNAVACPAASAIGTVDFETPVLPAGTLQGTVYLGKPLSGDPTSGDEYRIFLVADSARYGLSIRLVGHVVADPRTGRLTASFTDNPQVPVSLVRVALRGGDKATLVNPQSCGTSTAQADYTAWSGQTATATAPYTVDQGCAAPFAPTFAAGVSTAKAGASPTFTATIARGDGDQPLSRVDIELPPGLLAKPNGIPLCPDADAAAGTCPAASRIGTVATTAGAGNAPFGLGGQVYLTGPYGGGPYGLAIVVPAVAGPFDLGLVVVRASIRLDRNDAHVQVLSDPLPTILDGIPLNIRSVAVTIDRPDTMRNPTSCGLLKIATSLTSTGGANALRDAAFQPTDCGALSFAPKTAIDLTGTTQMTDGRHPGVDANVTQASGQANIRSVQVTLPKTLALDPDNAETLCEYADGLKSQCPAKSIIGTATARTPLLPGTLTGPVYFVKGVRFNAKGQPIRTLPTLLVSLHGQVDLDIRATTTVDSKSRLVTTFGTIPDAAVSSFHMVLKGGRHGILVVTTGQDACRGAQKAGVVATGQNAKVARSTATLGTPCAPAPKMVDMARLRGGAVSVAVRASSAGRLTFRGASGRLMTVSRTVKKKNQLVRVTLHPSKAARRLLAGGKTVKTSVVTRFAAKGRATSTVTSRSLTLRR
jgi:hypothetical protein